MITPPVEPEVGFPEAVPAVPIGMNSHPAGERNRRRPRDLILDLASGLLWGLVAAAFVRSALGRLDLNTVGLAIFYTLLAGNMAIRRPSRRAGVWWETLLAYGAVIYPLLLPRSLAIAGFPVPAAVLQVAGLAGMLAAFLSLGRSFGIAPADRGLVTHGLYAVVRHPLYLAELVFSLGWLVARFSWLGLLTYLFLVALQVLRITREERIIAGYAPYADRVRWRLVPGLW